MTPALRARVLRFDSVLWTLRVVVAATPQVYMGRFAPGFRGLPPHTIVPPLAGGRWCRRHQRGPGSEGKVDGACGAVGSKGSKV